jgi:hypothetical protein
MLPPRLRPEAMSLVNKIPFRTSGISPFGKFRKSYEEAGATLVPGAKGWEKEKIKALEKPKKILSSPMVDKITKNENTYMALNDASNELKANAEKFSQFMGPGKGALRHPLRSYVNKDLQDFLAWKTLAQDAFQQYRVAVTGAQASDKEIRFLIKNRPTEEDTYDVFMKKVGVLNRMGKKIFNRYLQNLGKAGYDVSGYSEENIEEPSMTSPGQDDEYSKYLAAIGG